MLRLEACLPRLQGPIPSDDAHVEGVSAVDADATLSTAGGTRVSGFSRCCSNSRIPCMASGRIVLSANRSEEMPLCLAVQQQQGRDARAKRKWLGLRGGIGGGGSRRRRDDDEVDVKLLDELLVPDAHFRAGVSAQHGESVSVRATLAGRGGSHTFDIPRVSPSAPSAGASAGSQ